MNRNNNWLKLIGILFVFTCLFSMCSCSSSSNLKWKPLTKRDLKEHGALLDSVVAYNKVIDSLTTSTSLIWYGSDSLNTSKLIIDTGKINTSFANLLSRREPRYDTSDVIVTHIVDWEAPIINILTAKIVYVLSPYGFYLSSERSDSKLFKVSKGVWVPIDWPKDVINIYIRPKE